MQLEIPTPQIKKISFNSYEKYFSEALKSPDDNHIIFFKKLSDSIEISFAWDGFIIITNITYSQILKIYEGQNMNTADVVLSDKEEHPVLIKFFSDYLFNRGIPEEKAE